MIGKIVSHYKILEKLGKGGMGEVYLAEDLKLDRKVALKFLLKEYTAGIESQERFKREAKAAAALNHPNIVTIHDISEYEDQTYIVMEYLEGQTLKNKILNRRSKEISPSDEIPHYKTEILQRKERHKEHTVPMEEIIDTIIQICKGLQKAHQAGIVHRDIKPQNIIIEENGRIKILDFGLAKFKGMSQLTDEFSTVGTLHYMSPEQVKGDEIDFRTDIWSVGVVMYEMITGRLPFNNNNYTTIMYLIASDKPATISEFKYKIPSGFQKVINRCLRKNPEERYRSIDELCFDLDCLRDEVALKKSNRKAKSTSFKYKLKRSLPKKITLPFVFLILVLLLIYFLPVEINPIKKWLGLVSMPEEKFIAVLPFTSISDNPQDLAFCDGLNETLSEKLSQLERFQEKFWVIPTKTLRIYKITTPTEARKVFEATLAVTGSMNRTGNTLNITLNLHNTKTLSQIKTITVQDHIANLSTFQDGLIINLVHMIGIKLTHDVQHTFTAGGTALPGAYKFYVQGRGYMKYENDEKKINLAINQFKRAIAQDSSYALAHASLGEACWYKYRLIKDAVWADDAISFFKQAIQINKNLAQVHYTLGIIYKEMKKFEESIKEFKHSIQINPGYFYAYLEIAKTYQCNKKLREAEEAYKKAIKLRRDYWLGFNYLGFFYYLNARYPEAVNMYKKAVELTPDNIKGYRYLGSIYIFLEKNDLAAAILKKSIAIKPDAITCSNLATIYYYQGRYSRAVAMYEKAINLEKDNYEIWGNLADAYRCITEFSEKALEAYKIAIKLVETQLVANPKDTFARSCLALYYARSGYIKNALAEISQLQEIEIKEVDVIKNTIIVFELANQRDKALKALREYIERFGAIKYINKERDLTELRKDQTFKKLFKKESFTQLDQSGVDNK